MKEEYKEFLEKVAEDHGISVTDKKAFLGIFNNQYWVDLLEKAVGFLSIVAIGSGDFKLAGILALLKSWIKDKKVEEEVEDQSFDRTYY